MTPHGASLHREEVGLRLSRTHQLNALTTHTVSQQEADQAAGLRQAAQQLQQQLHSSRAVAQQSQQQLQQQVQQLQRTSSDKENSFVQLQQKCQATQIQLQVRTLSDAACNR